VGQGAGPRRGVGDGLGDHGVPPPGRPGDRIAAAPARAGVTDDDERPLDVVERLRRTGARRGVRAHLDPRPATRPPVQVARQWGLREVGDERLAERDVEVHGTAITAEGPRGGREGAAHHRAPPPPSRVAGNRQDLRRRQVGVETGGRTEDARLRRGLVRAGAAHLVRPVRRQHDERDPGVVGLEHRREEVGHGRARRGDDGDRCAAGPLRQPEGEEPGGTLVDPHVEAEPPRDVRRVQRVRQRRRS